MNGKEDRADFNAGVGFRIQLARRAKRMTQCELARKCGTHRNVVHRMEAGLAGCTVWSLAKIAEALGVSVESLVPEKKVIF